MKPSTIPPTVGSQIYVWRRQWRQVLSEQQNHRCCWCGTRMCDEDGKHNSPTIEHITPLSKGGVDHPDNFAVACASCNSRRGSMNVAAFAKVAVELRKSAQLRALEEEKLRAMGIRSGRRKPGRTRRLIEQVQAREALERGEACPFPPGSRGYMIYERYRVRLAA